MFTYVALQALLANHPRLAGALDGLMDEDAAVTLKALLEGMAGGGGGGPVSGPAHAGDAGGASLRSSLEAGQGPGLGLAHGGKRGSDGQATHPHGGGGGGGYGVPVLMPVPYKCPEGWHAWQRRWYCCMCRLARVLRWMPMTAVPATLLGGLPLFVLCPLLQHGPRPPNAIAQAPTSPSTCPTPTRWPAAAPSPPPPQAAPPLPPRRCPSGPRTCGRWHPS